MLFTEDVFEQGLRSFDLDSPDAEVNHFGRQARFFPDVLLRSFADDTVAVLPNSTQLAIESPQEEESLLVQPAFQ